MIISNDCWRYSNWLLTIESWSSILMQISSVHCPWSVLSLVRTYHPMRSSLATGTVCSLRHRRQFALQRRILLHRNLPGFNPTLQKKERNRGNGENLRHLELLASLCPRSPLCRFTRQLQCLAVYSLWEPEASTLSHAPSIDLSLSHNVRQK